MARSPARLLLIGGLILALSLGIRQSFGLFLAPLSRAHGWGREVFGLAIASQNLVWGLAQPFAGVLADRIGTGPVLLGGAFLYALGLLGMAVAGTAGLFTLSAGLLIGLGLAGTTMSVVFAALSRALPPRHHAAAYGLAMAGGSLGQFVMVPAALRLIEGAGSQGALLSFAALAALMLPLALAGFAKGRRGAAAVRPSSGSVSPPASRPRVGALAAARQALGQRDFLLLSLGFFVCGFQVVFIATYLPADLLERGMAPWVGSAALALIGLFNILGSLGAGWLGARLPRPWLLVAIYGARAIAISLFLVLPPSPARALAFGAVIGVLWLSTVPLTNGVVAALFGVDHLAMLGGIAFLAHQLGSFAGGWLGGVVFARTGSFATAWMVAIGLSLIAMLLNAPVRERWVGLRAPAEG